MRIFSRLRLDSLIEQKEDGYELATYYQTILNIITGAEFHAVYDNWFFFKYQQLFFVLDIREFSDNVCLMVFNVYFEEEIDCRHFERDPNWFIGESLIEQEYSSPSFEQMLPFILQNFYDKEEWCLSVKAQKKQNDEKMERRLDLLSAKERPKGYAVSHRRLESASIRVDIHTMSDEQFEYLLKALNVTAKGE